MERVLRRARNYSFLSVVLGAIATSPCGCAGGGSSDARNSRISTKLAEPEAIFLEAWTLVRYNFYDGSFHGVNWVGVRDEIVPAARAATDTPGLARVISEALDRLHTSHTRHYTRDDREYYELLDIFHPPPEGAPRELSASIPSGPVTYVGIGLVAERIGDKLFAADVYDSGPAAIAGVHVGDELIGVEDGQWSDIKAFRGRAGVPTRVRIRRTLDGPLQTVAFSIRIDGAAPIIASFMHYDLYLDGRWGTLAAPLGLMTPLNMI